MGYISIRYALAQVLILMLMAGAIVLIASGFDMSTPKYAAIYSGGTYETVHTAPLSDNANLTAKVGANIIEAALQTTSFVETGEWSQYANGDYIQEMLVMSSTLWVASGWGGLLKWELTDPPTYTQYLRANAISANSGIATNLTSSLADDGGGGVWVGTNRGLSHFTGTSWVTYTLSNSGLVHPAVYGVARAADNTIWVATDGGANHFDPTNNSWETFTSANSGLPSDRLWGGTIVDGEGTVWFMDMGTYVTSFDGTTWRTYTGDDIGFSSTVLNRMAVDPQGRLMVGASPGIARWDGQGWTVIDRGHVARDLAYDTAGNLWTVNGSYVERFDGSLWTRFDLPTTPAGREASPRRILVGPNGLIWIGAATGFYSYEPANGNWRIFHHGDMPDGIPRGTARWTLIDAQGYPWFAHDGAGLYGGALARLDPQSGLWTKYTIKNSGLVTTTIYNMAQDQQGNFWLATIGGLQRFNGITWTTYTQGNSGLPSNRVVGVGADLRGNVWAATLSADFNGTPLGITRFDGQNWTTYNTQNSPLPSNFIGTIWADLNGSVWFGHIGAITRLDGQNWRVWRVGDDGWQGSVSTHAKFGYDRNGKLWVGGKSTGVSSWYEALWTHFDRNNSGILGNQTTSIQINHTGIEKWVPAGGTFDQYRRPFTGISVYNDEAWQGYTPDNSPLPHASSLDLEFDCRSVWFAGGGAGIHRLQVSPFSDITMQDYYFTAVQELFCSKVISGYSDGTFRPYNLTTRGQLCKIVTLAEGWPLYTPPTPTFSDVPPTDPFYPYIETAYQQGVISGYSDGTFRPQNNVTRGQLCKIVVLAEQWPLYTPPNPSFSDVPPQHTFYAHIETAYSRGIISGYADGTFRPGNNATRGQIAKIVFNAITAP